MVHKANHDYPIVIFQIWYALCSFIDFAIFSAATMEKGVGSVLLFAEAEIHADLVKAY